jgi:hypothetical protein
MRSNRTLWILSVVALLLVVGCAAKRQVRGFYNKSHRQRYQMTEAELRELQFYISKDVLVQGSPASRVEGEAVIILPQGTPGLVVESGPDWLQVAFEEEGTGVRFVTDQNQVEDMFWFATELPGKPGLHKIHDLPRKVLYHDGVELMVVQGDDAVLYVDKKDLEKLIATRTHLQGKERKR